MNKLLVQEFIKTKTLGELYQTHAVKVSPSKDGTLVSFNYNMLLAKDSDKLAKQCRGLILARKDGKSIFELKEYLVIGDKRDSSNVIFGDSVIASYGFDRFFNEGQQEAFVDWNDKDLKVYEKLDGTCIFVYHFNNKWRIATRSCPEADIPLDNDLYDQVYTFSSLFKKALKDTINLSFEDYTKTLDKDIVYIFELTSPVNIVVVNYPDFKATLLGARNKKTLQELNIEGLNNLVPCVKSYPFNAPNFTSCAGFVSSQNPLEHEGVVVKDSNFNRVKIKNENYNAFNKARDLFSKSIKGIIQLLLSGNDDDVIPYLPDEIKIKVAKYKAKLASFVIYMDNKYNYYLTEVNKYPDSDKVKKKEFASYIILNEKYHAPFFFMYAGKGSSMEDFFQKNKLPDGSWSNTFLDRLIEAIEAHQITE